MKTLFHIQLFDDHQKAELEVVPRKRNMFQLYTEICAQPPYSCIEWSCRNLIAFTSIEYLPTLKKSKSSRMVCSYPIYIVNPDSPTSLSCLSSQHVHAVKCIRWDKSGSKLISGDEYGMICLWKTKDHVSNGWQCEYSFNHGEGEAIAALYWLNSGPQYFFPSQNVIDKKDIPYEEKYAKSSCTNPLYTSTHLAWIAVTTTGKVRFYYRQSGKSFGVASTSLTSLFSSISNCDISLSSTGKVIIAIVDQPSRLIVSFYEVTIHGEMGLRNISLTCKFLSNIHLNSSLPSETQIPCEHYISHFKFHPLSESNTLLAVTSGPGADSVTCLQRWSVRTSQLTCNMVFPKPENSPTITYNDWEKDNHTFAYGSFVTSLNISSTGAHISICYADGHIGVYDSTSLAMVGICNTQQWGFVEREFLDFNHGPSLNHPASLDEAYKSESNGTPAEDSSVVLKRRKVESPELKCKDKACYPCKTEGTTFQSRFPLSACFSPNSCCFVVSDLASNLEVFELSSILLFHLEEEKVVSKLVAFLEYSVYCGTDWWDVLICLRSFPESTDVLAQSVFHRYLSSFAAQSTNNHKFFFSRVLAVLCTINRCIPSRSVECIDYNSLLYIHFILSTFRSCLSPSDSYLKSPALSLTEACLTVTTKSIDDATILLNLNEFTLTGMTPQSLWPLCSWVLNFGVFFFKNIYKGIYSDSQEVDPSEIPCIRYLIHPDNLLLIRELFLYVAIFRRKHCANSLVLPNDVNTAAEMYEILTEIWLKSKKTDSKFSPLTLLRNLEGNSFVNKADFEDVIFEGRFQKYHQNCYELNFLLNLLDLYPESDGILDSDIMGLYHSYICSKHAPSKNVSNHQLVPDQESTFHPSSPPKSSISNSSASSPSPFACPHFRISTVTLNAIQRPFDYPVDRWDFIRRVYIPRRMPLRICLRCHRFSLLRPEAYANDMAPIFWHKKWDVSCICGGIWREWAPENSTVEQN